MEKRRLAAFYLGLCVSALPLASVWATMRYFKAQHPSSYQVIKGDTFWHIAPRFLRTPQALPQVLERDPNNPDPYLLYPGDKIVVVGSGDNKRLRVQRGPQGQERRVVIKAKDRQKPMIKLSPKIKKTLFYQRGKPIDSDLVHKFAKENNRVITALQLQDASRVRSKNAINATHQIIYAERLSLPVGQRVFLYHPAETIQDESENLGTFLIYLGAGTVKARQGQSAQILIDNAEREIRPNDLVLPAKSWRFDKHIERYTPRQKVRGKIMSTVRQSLSIGQYENVIINKGWRDKLKVGALLSIKESRGLAPSEAALLKQATPFEETVGQLLVYRCFEKTCLALVTHLKKPVRVGVTVTAP